MRVGPGVAHYGGRRLAGQIETGSAGKTCGSRVDYFVSIMNDMT